MTDFIPELYFIIFAIIWCFLPVFLFLVIDIKENKNSFNKDKGFLVVLYLYYFLAFIIFCLKVSGVDISGTNIFLIAFFPKLYTYCFFLFSSGDYVELSGRASSWIILNLVNELICFCLQFIFFKGSSPEREFLFSNHGYLSEVTQWSYDFFYYYHYLVLFTFLILFVANFILFFISLTINVIKK